MKPDVVEMIDQTIMGLRKLGEEQPDLELTICYGFGETIFVSSSHKELADLSTHLDDARLAVIEAMRRR
jgi:hypothetical protein